MSRCYIRSLLHSCDSPNCQHKAAYIVYISQLVVSGRYCACHAKDKLIELKQRELL